MIKPRHFIPYRKTDIVAMCRQHGYTAQAGQRFAYFCHLLQSVFHHQFNLQLEQFKDLYAGMDPDADTRPSPSASASSSGELISVLENLLHKANYTRLEQADLEQALQEHSLFKIRLQVNFNEFQEVLLYARGESLQQDTVSQLFGWRKKTIRFTNYERVVVYLKFRDDFLPDAGLMPNCQPGATMLKLFQNVPKADLEMLFPNTRIRMRTIDKMLIGVPAVVSGTVVVTTKLGATLVLMGTLIGFWLGLNNESVELNRTTVLALLASLGTLAGYTWKQFSNFNNRKIKFLQVLTENLYFKNLDNNAGVVHRLLDEAEEEECKESILAYHTLLQSGGSLSASEIDHRIEHWFTTEWDCRLDFDIPDALHKLEQLGLVEAQDEQWRALPLDQAIMALEQRWDGFFEPEKAQLKTDHA